MVENIKKTAEQKGQKKTAFGIVAENLVGVSSPVRAKLAKEKALIKRAQQILSSDNFIPHQRTEFVIPDPYREIQFNDGSKTLFLAHDSGPEDSERIIIFATAQGLKILVDFKFWMIDGTFKSCVEFFFQLFTIHAKLNRVRSIPCIYCLLPNKEQTTYERLFQILKDLNPDLNPEHISIDFELGLINACRMCWLLAIIWLCLFHFSQSLLRKIKKEGLYIEYKKGGEVLTAMHCIKALAFLPCESIVIGYELIQEEYGTHLTEEIFQYLDTYYIGVKKGRGKKAIRLRPFYPVETWSVYERLMTDQPRFCH